MVYVLYNTCSQFIKVLRHNIPMLKTCKVQERGNSLIFLEENILYILPRVPRLELYVPPSKSPIVNANLNLVTYVRSSM